MLSVPQFTQGKVCKACNVYKRYEDYPRNRTEPDGYHRQCKICRNEQGIERRRKEREERCKPYNVPHLTPDWRMGWLFGESVEVERAHE